MTQPDLSVLGDESEESLISTAHRGRAIVIGLEEVEDMETGVRAVVKGEGGLLDTLGGGCRGNVVQSLPYIYEISRVKFPTVQQHNGNCAS